MSLIINKALELPLTQFSEVVTAQNTPIIQITAQYGLTDKIVTAVIGGSVSVANSLFVANTGTSAGGVAAILSDREISYRAGQGLRTIFSSIFSAGVANSTQEAGLITSESAFAFGFDGVDFGVLHSKDGLLEIQELQVTTPAAGAENASVTVDGTLFVIPITAGIVQQNAYQISAYLTANDPRYRYTSNNDTVNIIARLPEQGSGAFTFSSSGAAIASFTEISTGVIPTEYWTPKANWNVNPNFDIDPELGNVYMIQYAYTGFDGIKYYIKDRLTNDFELVHIEQYANTTTAVNATNPTFRVGWACRNTGNTTNISVKGSSAGAFIEGLHIIDSLGKGKCQTSSITFGADRNVLSFRNREVFNGAANRSETFIFGVSLATEATKLTIFKIIKNPILSSGFLTFQYFNETTSLMEFASDNVIITGGEEVACYATNSDIIVDLSELLGGITSGDTYSITAEFASGAAADMNVSLSWKDDF